MADDERTETEDESGSSNGHGSGTRTAVRAAAIAAASGATALAAKKAFSHTGGRGGSDTERSRSDNGDSSSPTSVVGSALSSAWESARQSLGPMLEEAAGQAGEYVARNSPELVRDTLVPRFIKGFEKAQKSASD